MAGGLGSRLHPLTKATNKNLLPIYNKPMIFYPIQTLAKAGIDDVMVVVGGPHAGHFIRVTKNGRELGVKHLEYAYQENEGGIGEALALCEDFSDGESIAVVLGDNITDADISKAVKNFKTGATIFLKKTSDPRAFGCPAFNLIKGKKIITAIEEKPKKPKSNYLVTGIYLYDNKVFDYIRQTKPSGRGELEITDVNNLYIKSGKLDWAEIKEFWCDAGSFDGMLEASQYFAKK